MTGFTELFSNAGIVCVARYEKGWPLKYANWVDKLGERLAGNGPGTP